MLNQIKFLSQFSTAVLLGSFMAGWATAAPNAAELGPKLGSEAKDFELTDLGGEMVKLSTLTKTGPVVLVVLRGYPGYQCPICTKQFAEWRSKADEFKKTAAQVVFIYPGAADGLKKHAADFVKGKDYPAHFHILLDPDYKFTNSYSLRWDMKNETAYPSTFVIDEKRKVTFAKVSTTHGDRAAVGDVLKAISHR